MRYTPLPDTTRPAGIRLSMTLRLVIAALLAFALALASNAATPPPPTWEQTVAAARGQTVNWYAWSGEERTNVFIARVGDEVRSRYGIRINHVKIDDTAEAVARVASEKAAGRHKGGSVDLIWINGPSFLTMKEQKLLYGPFAERLPNWRLVDTTRKRSNLIDFTIPHGGYESPWRMAQLVFVYDGKRVRDPPKSVADLLAWARRNPGRLTHPTVRNYLGSTFLKQALYELAPDPRVLQRAATDATFAPATAPMWAWYDALQPNLWHGGRQFPANISAQRQLMRDGEIDMMMSFNPSEAAVSVIGGLLPDTVRIVTFTKGMIGNTSFVAIPYNASAKEAAMVVANFLLEPEAQASAQDIRSLGAITVLDLNKLDTAGRKRFEELARHPSMPAQSDLGSAVLEPHPSWMTRIADEWERRYAR